MWLCLHSFSETTPNVCSNYTRELLLIIMYYLCACFQWNNFKRCSNYTRELLLIVIYYSSACFQWYWHSGHLKEHWCKGSNPTVQGGNRHRHICCGICSAQSVCSSPDRHHSHCNPFHCLLSEMHWHSQTTQKLVAIGHVICCLYWMLWFEILLLQILITVSYAIL